MLEFIDKFSEVVVTQALLYLFIGSQFLKDNK